LVDNLKIANLAEYYSSSSENTALLAEFKIALNEYLSELVSSPIRSLADAIAFNKKNPKLVSLRNELHVLCILALFCVCPHVIDITKTRSMVTNAGEDRRLWARHFYTSPGNKWDWKEREGCVGKLSQTD
jgi:hypothetical protein